MVDIGRKKVQDLMSERGSLVTAGSSDGPAGSAVSNFGSTNVPLLLVSAYQHDQHDTVNTLPKLPSHRFRYSIWHELSSTAVRGDRLKAPRIRDGPEEKDKFFYKIRDESLRQIHHTRRGAERKDYQNTMENWEQAEFCNLSYQDLAHSYQRENFVRVLEKLVRVRDLNLLEDEITDLSRITFPRCEKLNLNKNYLKSFKNLPKLPMISRLTLTDNNIEDLEGLERLAHSQLEYLKVSGNPVSYSINYRQRIFKTLPQLKLLDDIPKLPSDEIFEDDPDAERHNRCTIS